MNVKQLGNMLLESERRLEDGCFWWGIAGIVIPCRQDIYRRMSIKDVVRDIDDCIKSMATLLGLDDSWRDWDLYYRLTHNVDDGVTTNVFNRVIAR